MFVTTEKHSISLTIPESENGVNFEHSYVDTPQVTEPRLPAIFKAACIIFMMFGVAAVIGIYGIGDSQLNQLMSGEDSLVKLVKRMPQADFEKREYTGEVGFNGDGGRGQHLAATHYFGDFDQPTQAPAPGPIVPRQLRPKLFSDFKPTPTTTPVAARHHTWHCSAEPGLDGDGGCDQHLASTVMAGFPHTQSTLSSLSTLPAVSIVMADFPQTIVPRTGDSHEPLLVNSVLTAASIETGDASTSPVYPKANVLMPLYIDPGSDAWQPIVEAVKAYPSLNMTFILNPNNGPNIDESNSSYLDPSYLSGLYSLVAASTNGASIKFVGYVHQSYGDRSPADVSADIQIWSTWGALYGVPMDGIFFDESPITIDMLDYVRKSNTNAKNSSGFKTTSPITIQNPGSLPPLEFFAPSQNQDMSVIAEESYATYEKSATAYDGLAFQYGVSIDAFSFIFYAGPTDTVAGDMQSNINPMAAQAGNLFLTDLKTGHYEDFGVTWKSFIQAVAST